eukprot:CAMPEP_0172317390 /NCGR_PEP_ID=MMETSP1058-20130122/31421_1 /TAXON_ID=83371 /ORGANISM="Detonula confervacea, Strain CCMP 353" /LENGTH=351 /DNA_ID=CAMNT_0013031931 /DNA_START=102 /DNA_END=1157 /DNA_ORIENTATION=-
MPLQNTSNQNPIGNSKAAKFVQSNPLDPLANPFANLGDDEKEIHKEVSNNVQERLGKAMDELKEKHRKGTNEKDDVDRAPTGAAYKELHQHQRQQAKAATLAREQADARERHEENQQIMNVKEQMRRMKFNDLEKENADNHDNDNESESEDDDDEYGHLLDDEDDVLHAMRQARMAQLKQQQSQRATNISLGHGSLRTITQDEFLPECTGSSKYVIVHFYHDDFERCKIMDYHLKIIAQEHLEAKLLRIDVAKSPFFVSKLHIKTLPALFVFDNGKQIAQLGGFDGLAKNPKKPDEWHTGRLQEWIAGTGAIRYVRPTEEVMEEQKRLGIVVRGNVYSDRERSSGAVEDEY